MLPTLCPSGAIQSHALTLSRSHGLTVSRFHGLTLLALSKIDEPAKQLFEMCRRVTLSRSHAHSEITSPFAGTSIFLKPFSSKYSRQACCVSYSPCTRNNFLSRDF